MRETRMATHSAVSFDEGVAVRMLSGVLESTGRIKTFFKENDRTPNYDGSFEIINDDRTPKKQFIVQIKKAGNLVPKRKGKNKGKYVYPMDTAFLYYVKEKVTESPAIYFVVDIINKNIFWMYLSDEKLMSLDFEGANGNFDYAFSESEKLIDVGEFACYLNKVSEERNKLFLDKTPQEISEMQDAVEYINNYMSNDFVKIKEVMFPNLWRFGLRHSHSSSFSITIGEKTCNPKNTAMFELYPQIKGGKDTGLQEFSVQNSDGFYISFDLSGDNKPIDYSKESLEKIIKEFFENGNSFAFLPTIALTEKLNVFAKLLNKVYNVRDKSGKIEVRNLYLGFFWLVKYVHNIMINNSVTEQENLLKRTIVNTIRTRGPHSCNLISLCISCGCENSFRDFCGNNKTDVLPRFDINFIDIVKGEHIRYYLMAFELEKREIAYLEEVWDYDYYELTTLSAEEFIKKIDEICEKWFSSLPLLYTEAFDAMFDKNKYYFKGKFEYKNIDVRGNNLGPSLSNIIRKYADRTFSIINNPSITEAFDDEEKKRGLKTISSGLLFERFLQRRTMLFDSINCLLYKGVCEGLGVECQSLSVDGDSLKLF